jgi:hypothetical protein
MATKSQNGLAVWFGLNAGGAAFLGVWVYSIMSNDWLLGLVFGWIPALILAVIAGLVVYAVMYGVTGLAASPVQDQSTNGPPGGPATGITAH